MTFGTVLDLIAIILIPTLLTFLLGSLFWDSREKKRNEEAERLFEEELMRLYGGQDDDDTH